MDELENVAAPEAQQTMTLADAAKYAGVTRQRLRGVITSGLVTGVTKGPQAHGPNGGFQIPKSELDRLAADGTLAARKYKRKVAKVTGLDPDNKGNRMTIAEAAVRFGLGRSTLEKYVAAGKLPAEKAQLGLGRRKTFVKAADVAALRTRVPVSKHGRHPKTGVLPKAPVVVASDLNAELLRVAELVRSGGFTVSKLTVALEFVGGTSE